MSDSERQEIIDVFNSVGLDVRFFIQESFLGYKYRKQSGKLYAADSEIPKNLIIAYYGLNPDETCFDTMKKAFINKYIKNESKLENVHTKEEVEGLAEMYEYIHSEDINYMFDVYTMLDLHRKLYSKAPFPECAGSFRNFDVYLPGTGTETCHWRNLRTELRAIDIEIQKLVACAPEIKRHDSMDALFAYIDRCVELKCKLIKIHPFHDGNGRTIRGLFNKIFEDAGLPPVYIKENERTEYHKAMNMANNEGDYTYIKSFYYYKICDSIIELDINERTKKSSQNNPQKKITN